MQIDAVTLDWRNNGQEGHRQKLHKTPTLPGAREEAEGLPAATLFIYLYLRKGPRSVGTHLYTGGTLTITTIYYTLATLAYGPPPLGRPWGRIGVPELPKGCLGYQSHPKVLQILSISCFLVRISQRCGLKFLS